MYGKIENGRLVIAGKSITTKNGGTITNPTIEMLVENGYKEIVYNSKPNYDNQIQKLQEQYLETNVITISYEIVNLSQEEKREIIIDKVNSLEQQYNMCRWQREIILSENSGASEYTKTKAQEIENLAKELR